VWCDITLLTLLLCLRRYRKWDLGSGIELICRCEHDAATHGPNGELHLMNIKALNEWDSRVCNTFPAIRLFLRIVKSRCNAVVVPENGILGPEAPNQC